MADTDQQAKPLAPAAFQSRSDEEAAASSSITTQFNFRHRNCIKCFGCCTAFLLIIAVTILILFFTVFHVKNPVIKMNEITLLQLELNKDGSLRNGTNVTLELDISVKNPNVAPFRFNNFTTTVLYGGNNVGEARTPSGTAKARRTVHMNVTVDLIPEKILQVPGLLQDVSSGNLTMNSSTVIGGKVKILKIVKKYLVVEVNCSVTYNFSSKEIQQRCRPHFL
ncbi:uncharacterized protein LOC8287449 [Ricinus communis]|uniref:Late embryogenesis abundant protein LEA-2 subgroup domain-containing protein n=1 Tax=Ricinus communis TaxID=3988 RepID=B9RCJ0_RICCO|nr:uncharacterized protein LOC8287449 [Ricinus communis]EEF51261.1 conserved hypothetical protein [Ricinus communis]|eukprot:XP_002509874.1 uncharacterized protein LOC8287449 [Ricinus communis]